jgi:hypothetical protein
MKESAGSPRASASIARSSADAPALPAKSEDASRAERRNILAALLDRFALAERAGGSEDVTLEIAGHRVRLRFAGGGLAPRTVPALAHLLSESPHVDLTVYLWDSATTGVGMIPWPWPTPIELGPGGFVPAAAAIGLDVHCRVDNGAVSVLDLESGVAVLWIRDAAGLSRSDAAAPLRQVFSSWFAHAGLCVTHAAAIGREGRGVLLGGRGGSGKSTTALLCLEAGFDYAGDDYVLVDVGTGDAPPRAHSLYATGKVMDASAGRFPELSRAFDGGSGAGARGEASAKRGADGARDAVEAGEKSIAYLQAHVPRRLSRGFELVGLLLPVVTGLQDTKLVEVSAAVGLRGLAPSTVFQHGGGGGGMFSSLARLATRLPCRRLELGTDLAGIPACIDTFLAQRAQRSPDRSDEGRNAR